jgi:hypothetical protein
MVQVQKYEVLTELGKFFQLAASGAENLTMPSEVIDQEWHNLIEDKEAYEQFCIKKCGTVIEHKPCLGDGLVEWTPVYEARFGKLPQTWFIDKQGIFDEQAYKGYLETGKWYAGWDCSPAVPTMN